MPRVSKRWRWFLIRVVIAAGLAFILASVPLPRLAPRTWLAYVQVPLIVFVFVCFVGKMLIDTFYDNHQHS